MLQIAAVIGSGIFAQWISWIFRIPSIVLLLFAGFAVGPIFGILNPEDLQGELLFSFVSIAVALILFEGGLSLRFSEIAGRRTVVFSLVSVGFLVTWVVIAAASTLLLQLDLLLSVLLGAILTVSGPTVVIPLLRQVQPRPPLSQILKWEGILIDPVGALAAVLVFEVIIGDLLGHAYSHLLIGVIETILYGGGFGVAGAVCVTLILKRHWVPEYLEIAVTLAIVVLAHVLSNALRPESGLLAVTLMGVILANIPSVSIRNVLEFKENLTLLLISVLFVILAARVSVSSLSELHPFRCLLFIAVVIVIARPAAITVATFGSTLQLREKAFLSFLAPRGIVAAAVSSLFALELSHKGFPDAKLLMPYTFMVIVSTVVVYGLGARPFARLLGMLEKSKEGVLFLGARPLVRAIAAELSNHGFTTMLLDSNSENIRAARLEGLSGFHGNALSGDIWNDIDLTGIGRFLAMTANSDTNALAAVQFTDVFGRQEVYQLAQSDSQRRHEPPQHLRGKFLFSESADFSSLESVFRSGARVKTTPFSDKFTQADYAALYQDKFVPLFIITEDEKLAVCTADKPLQVKAGQRLVALVDEPDQKSIH